MVLKPSISQITCRVLRLLNSWTLPTRVKEKYLVIKKESFKTIAGESFGIDWKPFTAHAHDPTPF